MTTKFKNGLIIGGIVIILFLPIIISYINSKKIVVKTIDEFKAGVPQTSFSLYYFGNLESDKYPSIKEDLIAIRNENDIDLYSVDYKENNEYLSSISPEFENGSAYVFVRDGEIFKVASGSSTKEEINNKLDHYYKNNIPTNEVAYKTVSTFKEYMTLVNSKKTIMAVFGRNSCSWCNRFKPVYNDVAKEYDLDIYYFDSDSFNSSEYSKILNSGLMIPAECTKSKTDEPLSNGFGTPLTIITKNGKSISCIGGYVNKTVLINKLKDVNLIK